MSLDSECNITEVISTHTNTGKFYLCLCFRDHISVWFPCSVKCNVSYECDETGAIEENTGKNRNLERKLPRYRGSNEIYAQNQSEGPLRRIWRVRNR